MLEKRVVFMGSPYFADVVFRRLVADGHKVVGAFTRAPNVSGRGQKIQCTAVENSAREFGIPVFSPKTLRDESAVSLVRDLCPDVVVVAAYGLIIPQSILDIPRFGCLNTHSSLLPRWRGASPIHHAIKAGDKITGVTIMRMDAGVDTGDVIAMEHVPTDGHNLTSLTAVLAEIGARMMSETLCNIENLSFSKQSDDGVSYAPKIAIYENRICWNLSMKEIVCHVSAFAERPGAYTFCCGVRCKILEVVQNDVCNVCDEQCGTVLDEKMHVCCADGCVQIKRIQPAGRGVMSGEDFLRGHMSVIGSVCSDS